MSSEFLKRSWQIQHMAGFGLPCAPSTIGMNRIHVSSPQHSSFCELSLFVWGLGNEFSPSSMNEGFCSETERQYLIVLYPPTYLPINAPIHLPTYLPTFLPSCHPSYVAWCVASIHKILRQVLKHCDSVSTTYLTRWNCIVSMQWISWFLMMPTTSSSYSRQQPLVASVKIPLLDV